MFGFQISKYCSYLFLEQGNVSKVGSEENARCSTEKSSFSIPDKRHSNMSLPHDSQEETINQLDNKELKINTVDRAQNMSRFENLDDADLSIDTASAETDNPRPETIGGDASPNISRSKNSDLDVTSPQDETDLKLHDQRHLNHISEQNFLDSGYTTLSESILRPICNIENRPENQTDGQKIKLQENSSFTDSVQVKPLLVLSSSTSNVIRPSSASFPMPYKKKSRNTLSKIGDVQSLAVKSFSNSDLAFK
ncbi:uncharacterized protein LOC132751425 [Ruditapes philippinarum]|uniref:uncharacterized protein LOC132751425 n=1 Tax=Ruditapes philippinarum TaxID=129788 RepID=UPI00295BE552|nr:uncharacterized protein LOC132751425 [Ruditapes philippinarum]